MKEKYIILSRRRISELEILVRQKMAEGYIPIGGISTSIVYNPHNSCEAEREYCQAMIIK